MLQLYLFCVSCGGVSDSPNICVRWFSIGINSNGAVVLRGQSIQESESSLVFLFCRKRDVWVDRIEEIVKCHCVLFDDALTDPDPDITNKNYYFIVVFLYN